MLFFCLRVVRLRRVDGGAVQVRGRVQRVRQGSDAIPDVSRRRQHGRAYLPAQSPRQQSPAPRTLSAARLPRFIAAVCIDVAGRRPRRFAVLVDLGTEFVRRSGSVVVDGIGYCAVFGYNGRLRRQSDRKFIFVSFVAAGDRADAAGSGATAERRGCFPVDAAASVDGSRDVTAAGDDDDRGRKRK